MTDQTYLFEELRTAYSPQTKLAEIHPGAIEVLPCSSSTMVNYQKQMSKAVWRPAPGRKLGFLVIVESLLLGIIFLASPVIRIKARDKHLFPTAGREFSYGAALREYMDMSVCVAAQPIGWHWNLGKLLALLAPTFGDYITASYPDDEFKGITTTSLWGRGTQYNRIYKFLGYTKGHGHAHISDEEYYIMVDYLKSNHLPDPGCGFSDGSNTRMRRIAAYKQAAGDKSVTLRHGQVRGVYYHAAIPSEQRLAVIQQWYERWGLPRYERTKELTPPYQTGLA